LRRFAAASGPEQGHLPRMQGTSEGEERARADRALTKTYSFNVDLNGATDPLSGRAWTELQLRR
jgi:hypothetical protein